MPVRLPIYQRQATLPTRTGAAAPSIESAQAVGRALTEGASALNKIALELEERRQRLQQATDVLKAESALQRATDSLLSAMARDSAYQDMERRYPEEFDKAFQEVFADIQDPVTQVRVRDRALTLRREVVRAARTRAVTLQASDARGALDVALADDLKEAVALAPAAVTAAAEAGSDLSRARLQTPDGSFSTERTITVEAAGRHYLIPTIVGGRELSSDDAIAAWQAGQNPEVGVFDSAAEAQAAAEARSQAIGRIRGPEADLQAVMRRARARIDELVAAGALFPEDAEKRWLQFQEEVRQARSTQHVATIEAQLSAGNDRAAAAYLKAATARGELVGDDLRRAQALVADGQFRLEAQRQEDRIYGRHLNDREGALAEARRLTDGKLRDEVVRRLHARFAEAEKIQRDQEEEALRNAYQFIAGGGRVDQLSPSVRVKIAPHLPALQRYEHDLRAGVEPVTDWQLYYDLKTQASSPELQEQFLRTNLYQYVNRLSPTEFKELTTLQTGLRAKDPAAEAAANGYLSQSQVVNDTLIMAGLDPSPDVRREPKAAKRVAEFRRQVDEAVRDWKRRTGKTEIPTDELRAIAERLLVRGPVPGTGFFGTNIWRDERFGFELAPGERLAITPADIPPRERRRIENALAELGIPVSDDIVVELFNARLQETLDRGR